MAIDLKRQMIGILLRIDVGTSFTYMVIRTLLLRAGAVCAGPSSLCACDGHGLEAPAAIQATGAHVQTNQPVVLGVNEDMRQSAAEAAAFLGGSGASRGGSGISPARNWALETLFRRRQTTRL